MLKPKGIHNYYAYIITNKNKTVLYTGVTNNLKRRLYEHNNPKKKSKSFSARYNTGFLLYYEHFTWIQVAIAREKQIKGISRSKKESLINGFNPEWAFLNARFE